MDIKSSLIITEQFYNHINFITMGSFVRVYNQSFYLLTQQLGYSLKPIVATVKSADNRFAIYGGLPVQKLPSIYPDVIGTQWGYQLSGEFDLTDYENWFSLWQARARWQQANLLSSSQN